MRRLCYSVAASLDGYIAGPNGEYDWIPMDPDIDFPAMFASYDALVMGRRSYEVTAAMGQEATFGVAAYVYSRTLPEGTRGGFTFVRDGIAHARMLKEQPGKDLWLWGGGELYRELAGASLVDAVTVAIVPVLLGGGIRLVPAASPRRTLHLRSHRIYPKTGTVFLEYDIREEPAGATAV